MSENVHNADDFEEHKRTYEYFIRGTRWGVGGAIVVLVLMAIFLL